jgi:hypothetical protein
VTPRKSSYERVLGVSLAVSLLVHLLLLLLSPLLVEVGAPPSEGAEIAAESAPAFGMQAMVVVPSENAPEIPEVVETPAEVPRFQAQPPPRPVPPQPGATPGPTAPAPGPQTPAAGAPEGSSRDALRPGFRDPRLYVAPQQFPELQKTEHERYMEHLQARIDAVNDSMRVAANRERRTSDWTVTDGSGNRWGLSPDGLHLGGMTVPRELLPLPAATGDNQSLEADRERQRQRDEIQRQEDDRERRRIQQERTRAIEENRRQGSGDGG